MKTLRTYQEAALKGLWNWLFTEGTGNPLVVAPVGSGKSLMMAEFIRQCHEKYPRTRIVVVTHVKELLKQNAEELMGQYLECDFGFYCAGLNQKRLHNDITFASIQSVKDKVDQFNRPPEIIIVDECHLISHKAQTQYRSFFDAVHNVNQNAKIIGFTGTPFRADTGRLDEGENALFSGVAYEVGMDYMIEEGFWAKPVAPSMAFQMDVTGVGTRAGDYIEKQLQDKINVAEVTDACIKELIEKGQHRKKWLIFTAGIQHAEEVTAALVSAGVHAECFTSETPEDQQQSMLARHRAGEFKALVNVAKLTTGYNDPGIDLLCYMRPTRSPVLYIQTMGRGVRPVYADGYDLSTKEGRLAAIAASDKPDCMVLDFGGVIKELGPIDQVSIRKTFTGENDEQTRNIEPVTKVCPNCAEVCSAAQRYCYNCSYCFIELSNKASESAILSTDEPPEWYEVIGMGVTKHIKKDDPDAPPTMKVTYATLGGQFYDFVCFEHYKFQGTNKYFAYEKAVQWYRQMVNPIYDPENNPPPDTVDEAAQLTYLQPSHILVKRNGKYFNVIDHKFEPKQIEDEDEGFEVPF